MWFYTLSIILHTKCTFIHILHTNLLYTVLSQGIFCSEFTQFLVQNFQAPNYGCVRKMTNVRYECPYNSSSVRFVCRPKLLCNAASVILFWAIFIDHLYHQEPVARWRQGHLVAPQFPRTTSDFFLEGLAWIGHLTICPSTASDFEEQSIFKQLANNWKFIHLSNKGFSEFWLFTSTITKDISIC